MNQQNTYASGGNAIFGTLMSAGRLLFDSRVPLTLKLLLPVAAMLYWIWPIDLIPGLPIDDVAVLAAALYFFVHLASQSVTNSETKDAGSQEKADAGPVVDTSWRVIE